MTSELLKKAEELLGRTEVIMLSSIEEDGYPRTAGMCNLKSEGINTIWFSTGTDSHKTLNFKRNGKAGVCVCAEGNNITLKGKVAIVDDIEVKQQLWEDWFIKHYPLGVTDPNYCVLRFETEYIQAYIDDEFDEKNLK